MNHRSKESIQQETPSPQGSGGPRLRILVWGINYAPEETGIAPYNTDLCAYLRDQGCQVSMLTAFPYYPHWRKKRQDRWRIFRAQDDDRVRVYRCGLYVPSRPTAIRRMLHEATFSATSFLAALFLPRPDAIFVVSPPLLLGVAARLLSLVKHAPYQVHVQDMQPDAAIEMGFLRPGLLTKLLYRLESIAYGGAAQVSGITHGMLRLFDKKAVDGDRAVLFPNWEIPSEDAQEEAQVDFRKLHQIPESRFLLAYSGNLGRKQGLSILLDAAAILRDSNPQALILIAGDGGEKAALADRVQKERLPNVKLLPLLPASEYRALLRQADVFFVTQQQGSGALFFPSKLLRILAAAKPVIAVADATSELHQAAQDGQWGICVPPDHPELLAEAVQRLAAEPAALDTMAASGPIWMRQFDRATVLDEFYRRIRALAGSHASSPSFTESHDRDRDRLPQHEAQ